MNPPVQDVGVENIGYILSFFVLITVLGLVSIASSNMKRKLVLLLAANLITIWVIAHDQHARKEQIKIIEDWKKVNVLDKKPPTKEKIDKIYFLKFESDDKAVAKIYLDNEKSPKTIQVNIIEDKNIKVPELLSNDTVKIKNLEIKQLIYLNTDYELSDNTNVKEKLNAQENKYNRMPWFDYLSLVVMDGFFIFTYVYEVLDQIKQTRRINNETIPEEENVDKKEEKRLSLKRKIRT